MKRHKKMNYMLKPFARRFDILKVLHSKEIKGFLLASKFIAGTLLSLSN